MVGERVQMSSGSGDLMHSIGSLDNSTVMYN